MDKTIKTTFDAYKKHRKVNRRFFELLSKEALDFKMVSNEKVSSDTPRQNLAHIVGVTRCYVDSVENGTLNFDWRENADIYPETHRTKVELLDQWDEEVDRLADLLEHSDATKKIVVPWGEMTLVELLDTLKDHEVLHTGINLAAMDHLGMERFDELKEMWGE